MSKEIAQTVGGKRIAWLLAILAAFAVFATLATQWQTSEASVTGTMTISDAPDPVSEGGTVTYTATVTTNAVSEGIVVITIDADNALTNVGATAVACPAGGVGGGGITWTAAMAANNVATCTASAALTAAIAAGGTMTAAFQVPSGAASVAAPTGTVADTTVCNVGCSVAATGATATTVTAAGTVTSITPNPALLGSDQTIVWNIPANITGQSDPNKADATRVVTSADVSGCTAGCSIQSVAVADTNQANASNVTVVVRYSVAGTYNLALLLTNTQGTAGLTDDVNITSNVAAATGAAAELRHMSDTVVAPAAPFFGVLGNREVSINVRNSRHTVCTVAGNTGIDLDNDGVLDASDVAPAAVALPGITLANIVVTNGGGYATTIDTDPTFSDVRVFVGDGTSTGIPTATTTAGLAGATCISWVSLDAGDQSISLVYVGADGANYSVHWDTDGDANDNDNTLNDGVPNTTLVKEWNRLEDSTLTLSGGATGSVTGTGASGAITRNIGVTLNPSTGLYQFTNVNITDIFRGSHTNSAGQKEGPAAGTGSEQFANGLVGVNWTVALAAGSCGAIASAAPGGVLTYVTTLGQNGLATNYPNITFSAGGAGVNCGPGRTATINFTGSEPGPLGSGTGIIVTESVTFTFSTEIAAKQVFLAWAGQRVILEHDWRIPAGDKKGTGTSVDPVTGSVCPFLNPNGGDLFQVKYVKGSGPGNFLPSFGAAINGSDEATVIVDGADNSQTDGEDIIDGPNGSCISRVLFESEDQGQVDIEAFVTHINGVIDGGFLGTPAGNVTKHAFVVYYMKINTINVSLATQFSKPSHNGSNRTVTTMGGAADATHYADWASGTAAPSNPWDASKDDADNATEWNVSKDLLVRGRVTGWFVNSNPSGRARDDSNPLNVLPADRWVMPGDWPLLAGGPADPADGSDAIGTAEQFRPYYDIMFAPNNTRGIALTTPEGNAAVQVAVVAVSPAFTNTTTSFVVSSCVSLPTNATIWVGSPTVSRSVASCSSNVLTVAALTGVPAAGTPIFLVTGVPFEGPFSLLDIKGFAAEGKGGAALSDFDPNNIRDTTKEDGDVDMWDAPMPPAPVSVQIRGTGFIKEVIKDEVYYLGTPNSALQTYPNPYYIQDIPDSPFIPAIVVGGGYFWDTWGSDGPGGLGQGVYRFWTPAIIGTNSAGVADSFTSGQATELGVIRSVYGDNTIARDLVLYTDNHGEFMVAANGDYRTNLAACATNVLAGGKHCKPGDKVGTGTITATVDYPDFRGKHFPVLSNAATVDWTWGGYKDVTVEDGETDQFKYIVFHGMDRDGFCNVPTGAVSLHPVYSSAANDAWTGIAVYPPETIDFLIDSGEGIIIEQSGVSGTISDGKQFATGLKTFSLAVNNPALAKSDTTGNKEFPLSSLAAEGQTDECQAWIKVSNSLLGVLNVLTIAHDDEGNIGFDRVIDLTNTHSYTLTFRWSLITWVGADAIAVNDAIKGTGTSGKNPGGNDISASVTAIYGWDASAQQWLGFFPSGVNVPGANDLTALSTGDAYWVAITGPSSVTWTVASNVN